jgi:hypothetical protein
MKQSHYIHEPDEFLQFVTDTTKHIQDFYIINEGTAQLQWKHTEDFRPDDCRTNIFLATFTTTWARLRLYAVLDLLGEACLYYDTDSCIYVCTPGMKEPPTGDYLGDLTNELPPNRYMEEFVSAGPKNYAYRLDDGSEVCKVRGFTLNFRNSKLINFQAIKDMVVHGKGGKTVVNPGKINRDVRKRKVYNREERKKYSMVYTKRVVLPNLNTVPYGYVF